MSLMDLLFDNFIYFSDRKFYVFILFNLFSFFALLFCSIYYHYVVRDNIFLLGE